jgi:hypothetical protein
MGRVEEILEVADIIGEAAERLVQVLELAGAGELHDPDTLRDIARRELEFAAADVARLALGNADYGSD